MFTDSKNWYRLAAAISLLLWLAIAGTCVAYDTPGAQHWNDSHEANVYGGDLHDRRRIGAFDGFPGWFAGIFWAWAVWQTSFGRAQRGSWRSALRCRGPRCAPAISIFSTSRA